MFSNRQRRRIPSSPEDNHGLNNSQQPLDAPKENFSFSFKGAGLFSSKRRSPKNGHRSHHQPIQPIGGPLPTHYSTAGGTGGPSSNTCQNFLMGGQFYPGKDKVRRHMRKKTIWHRMFCSSPGRIVCTLVTVAYILLWHMLVPLTDLLLEYGRQLSPNVDLLVPTIQKEIEENLTSDSYEKRLAQNLQKDRLNLLYGSTNQVLDNLKLFKHSAPQFYAFYHGKDDAVDGYLQLTTQRKIDKKADDDADMAGLANKQDDSDDHHEIHKVQIDGSQSSDEKGNVHHKNAVNGNNGGEYIQHNPNENYDESASSNEDQDLPEQVLEERKLRSIQNMDSIAAKSRCPSNLSPDDISTTLIVQCSVDRMWILKETCTRWKDPIVAVIHFSSSPSDGTEWQHVADWSTICPQITIIPHTASANEKHESYPVNMLRNIALDAVTTSHVLVVDVDFVPSMDLHESIQTALDQSDTAAEERNALVIPAFERTPPKPCVTNEDCAAYLQENSSFIPHSFDDLKKCIIKDKSCDVFQRTINWEGHYSTHSDSWLKQDWYKEIDGDQKLLKSIDCFDSLRYEPYVVIRWCPIADTKSSLSLSSSHTKPVAPYYDERFHGYGKNKIQMVSHLRYMGYTFSILPGGFIVHNPHPESNAKKVWNNVKDNPLHHEMDKLYPQFLGELVEKYRVTTKRMVGLCKQQKK